MEHLIREFGAWLKQGFGWLVDVIVFGCLWGISHDLAASWYAIEQRSDPEDRVARSRVLLLILYAFYWAFGRFIGVIRWALDRIAYALGVILFSAAVVSGVFASAGLVAVVVIWVMGNIHLASRWIDCLAERCDLLSHAERIAYSAKFCSIRNLHNVARTLPK